MDAVAALKAYRARLLRAGKVGPAAVVQACIDIARQAATRADAPLLMRQGK